MNPANTILIRAALVAAVAYAASSAHARTIRFATDNGTQERKYLWKHESRSFVLEGWGKPVGNVDGGGWAIWRFDVDGATKVTAIAHVLNSQMNPTAVEVKLTEAGYNCALWGGQSLEGRSALDEAERNGVLGILHLCHYLRGKNDFDALRAVVSLRKNEPGLFAWYLADEPEAYGDTPEVLRKAYRIVKAIDPNHPVIVLIHGAKGILWWPYSVPRQKYLEHFTELGRRCRVLEPFLLHGEPVPGMDAGVQRQDEVHWRAWQHGGQVLVLAANLSQEAKVLTAPVPGGVERAQVLFENRELTVQDGTVTDDPLQRAVPPGGSYCRKCPRRV